MKSIATALFVVLLTAATASAQCTWVSQTSPAGVAETCGNVGIGATNPTKLLQITYNSDSYIPQVFMQNLSTGVTAVTGYTAVNDAGTSFMFGQAGSHKTAYGAQLPNSSSVYTTSSAGLVLMDDNAAGVVTFATGGNAEKMRLDAAGHLGVGTAAPQQSIHVGGGAVEVTSATFATNYATRAPSLIFSRSDLPTSWLSRITNSWSGTPSDSTMNFEVTSGPASYITPLTLTGGGFVGIGQPAPLYPLDVAGAGHFAGAVQVDTNLTATGTISGGNVIARYQDVAEWVPATTAMPPGTVVVLNLDRNNEVMPSARAYDTAVAGVVSTNPGVLLGVAAVSKAQIATTGRVRVRVDATKEPVKVGDLLVTSDRSGFAMKSIPLDLGGVKIHRPGTLIGKALEPLPSGEGEILVLLSLQ